MNKRKKSKVESKVKAAKINSRFWLYVFIFCLLSLIFSATYFAKDKIEGFVNFYYNDNAISTAIYHDGLKVHFIDVGQADATLIEFPTGETMLIDSGDKTETSHSKFVSYLNNINFKMQDGERVLDYFILTHPDKDHIGGAEYIFDEFKVNYFYRPDIYSSSEEEDFENIENSVQYKNELYDRVIKKAKEEDLKDLITTSQDLRIPSEAYSEETPAKLQWEINFYAPITEKLPYINKDNFQDPIKNDYSPIMILSYMDIQIMFTGDAGEGVEKSFVEKYDDEEYSYIDFDVDFLKLGHHGSRYSSCMDFLNFITPEYAIASAGANNSYGHPSTYTLERLYEYGMQEYDVYRTDLNGTIIVSISQEGEIGLRASNLQYTSFKVEWWMLYLTVELILIISLIIKYVINNKKN